MLIQLTQVVTHLVNRIEDKEMSIRLSAASLFSTLSPALVLPILVPRVSHTNPNIRSSAEDALKHIMTHHHDPINTMSTLVDCLRHHINGTEAENQKTLNRIIHAAPGWIDHLNVQACNVVEIQSQILMSLVNKMLAAPDDSILVRIVSSCLRCTCVTKVNIKKRKDSECIHVYGKSTVVFDFDFFRLLSLFNKFILT